MKLPLSLLVSFHLLLLHFNFAEGGKKEANEKGKRDAAEKKAAQGINNIFRKDNDLSALDDAEGNYIVVFKKNKIKNEKTEAAFLTRKAKGKPRRLTPRLCKDSLQRSIAKP